jgi:hypothetical protein
LTACITIATEVNACSNLQCCILAYSNRFHCHAVCDSFRFSSLQLICSKTGLKKPDCVQSHVLFYHKRAIYWPCGHFYHNCNRSLEPFHHYLSSSHILTIHLPVMLIHKIVLRDCFPLHLNVGTLPRWILLYLSTFI